jgi:hypothetical protein
VRSASYTMEEFIGRASQRASRRSPSHNFTHWVICRLSSTAAISTDGAGNRLVLIAQRSHRLGHPSLLGRTGTHAIAEGWREFRLLQLNGKRPAASCAHRNPSSLMTSWHCSQQAGSCLCLARRTASASDSSFPRARALSSCCGKCSCLR